MHCSGCGDIDAGNAITRREDETSQKITPLEFFSVVVVFRTVGDDRHFVYKDKDRSASFRFYFCCCCCWLYDCRLWRSSILEVSPKTVHATTMNSFFFLLARNTAYVHRCINWSTCDGAIAFPHTAFSLSLSRIHSIWFIYANIYYLLLVAVRLSPITNINIYGHA